MPNGKKNHDPPSQGAPRPLHRVRYCVYQITQTTPMVKLRRLKHPAFTELEPAAEWAREYAARHNAHTTVERRTYKGRRLISTEADVAVF